MGELDEEEDVVFEALVVETGGVVRASWALGDEKMIGQVKEDILHRLREVV